MKAGSRRLRPYVLRRAVVLLALGVPAPAAFATGMPLSVETESADARCHDVEDGWAVATVTGGTPPFTYEWMPSGGNADVATGLGAGGYVVTVTDSLGAIAQATAAINAPPPIWFDAAPLPDAHAYAPYVIHLVGGGGTGTVTYSVGDGPLPAGLRLFADGTLSGTPALAGSHAFGVTATDALACVLSQAYSLTVVADAEIVYRDGFDSPS